MAVGTTTVVATETERVVAAPRRPRGRGWLFHALMIPFVILWVLPMVFVLFVALRSFDDLASRGLGALPGSLSLEGFKTAFLDGDVPRALRNSAIVTVPTVIISLLLASMAAFALSRYQIPMRRTVLLVMLAGNLLPPQILLIPVTKITESLGIYDTLLGLIVIQIGFGLGFYTFVLHGFMRSIPRELTEAAVVDGAPAWQIYARIVMPLCRPALAALSALATTWVFNDLIWSISVLRSESKYPITAELLNLQGTYVSQWNVVASAALIAALPTAVVFFAFQKHFVSGLLVGSSR
jgi:multiple sugar transport system permease protein